MSDPDHRIIVRPIDGAFSVTVEPPHEDHEPRLFGDFKSANGFAGGLRLVTGWTRIIEDASQ